MVGGGGRRWEGGEWEEVDESVREPERWETVRTVRGEVQSGRM